MIYILQQPHEDVFQTTQINHREHYEKRFLLTKGGWQLPSVYDTVIDGKLISL